MFTIFPVQALPECLGGNHFREEAIQDLHGQMEDLILEADENRACTLTLWQFLQIQKEKVKHLCCKQDVYALSLLGSED